MEILRADFISGIATESSKSNEDEQRRRIGSLIYKAATYGDYNVVFSEELYPSVKEELLNKGYNLYIMKPDVVKIIWYKEVN